MLLDPLTNLLPVLGMKKRYYEQLFTVLAMAKLPEGVVQIDKTADHLGYNVRNVKQEVCSIDYEHRDPDECSVQSIVRRLCTNKELDRSDYAKKFYDRLASRKPKLMLREMVPQ